MKNDLISRKAAKEMFLNVPMPIAMTGQCCAGMLDDLPSVEAELHPIEADPRSGGLNYEAELAKAKEEICKLKEKCQYWEMRCDELDRERHFLGAQMDVVRLIFGG